MSKIKKILGAIFIVVTILGISTFVNASFQVFEGDINQYVQDGHFYPTSKEGGVLFCIQYGGAFNNSLTTITRYDYETYKAQQYIPSSGDYECVKCTPTLELPWYGVKKYIRYEAGETIDYLAHQDEAYNLANYEEEEGTVIVKGAQLATWSSTISNPMQSFVEGLEGTAYKQFYESIQGGFENHIVDLTPANVKIAVNQDEGSYTVGPYKQSYPNGQYEGKNKFCWINSIKANTSAGILNAQVLSAGGAPITDLGKNGANTLNQIDYYVKFYSTEALDFYGVDIEWEYLHHCEAEMKEYIGTVWSVSWERETGPDECDHSYWEDQDGDGHDETFVENKKEKRRYKFVEEASGEESQKLMLYTGTARKVYQKVQKRIGGNTKPTYNPPTIPPYNPPDNPPDNPPPGVDLTINISGKVFLDKDTGKTNTGNDEYDEGEALPGVEVTLYDSEGNQVAITLSNKNGEYGFSRLNAQKKYYVKFTYNGMLYTNVLYRKNGDNTSKATEEAQGHTNNRSDFNNKFAEIGSYPSNYKTRDCITGETIYNPTFLQEEIVDVFKAIAVTVAGNGGNEQAAYASVMKTYGHDKVQYAADCRINAYTVERYPLINVFTPDSSWQVIAGQNYNPIYAGTYNETNVNLGVKARTTFDMALYKDVLKAEVVMNGKTQTYNYDVRKSGPNGFTLGLNESTYLNRMGEAYKEKYAIANYGNTRDIETDTYDIDLRSEEVANGQSSNYNQNNTQVVKDDGTTSRAVNDNNYQLNEDYNNLKRDGENAADRLKIYVTYKVAVRNQSATIGAITELVDYYDTNFEFVRAYVGDANGNQTGTVTKYDNSMYPNSEYKASRNGYKTIYLRPDAETRLGETDEQYIYVVLQLLGPTNDAGELLSERLLNNQTLEVMNLAEINGYKTYNNDGTTPGLVDIDSNPGNLNISNIDKLSQENILAYPNIKDMYEDDTSRAPAYIHKLLESRTIEGRMFEDNTKKDAKVYTNEDRNGDGKTDLDTDSRNKQDKPVQGAIVELVEIKNGQMIVRAATTTNEQGWYGFTGFLPGDYTVRFTYGSNDDTAMARASWYQGVNDTSYNGQDYQSTKYGVKNGIAIESIDYNTDEALKAKYNINNSNKNSEENVALTTVRNKQLIDKYNAESGYYWYTVNDSLSDARDDDYRVNQVIQYSKQEYGKEIVNHKAEVFNSYVQPQASHITKEFNRTLVDELERRTYRYAYTPEIEIEVEYAREGSMGNGRKASYEHRVTGVDFGIVERPKSELVIDQDVENIKVTAADGNTVLFDTKEGTNNLQWIKGQSVKDGYYNGKKIADYDKNELINIIMDDELISGSKLEVTYKLKITNNSEKDVNTTTRAKSIINYVANNLEFDEQDNILNGKALWKVVSKDSVQKVSNSTFVNNTNRTDNSKLKLLDLSTQNTILEATPNNPLTKILKPGESTESTLVLKKVLSAESSQDDLSYTNLTEIVEIDNTVGRYDHGATPGNQSVEVQPQEHDTSGASRFTSYDSDGNVDEEHPQDGTIIITPPTGSTHIYYVLGIGVTILLAVGLYLINRFVVRRGK